MPFYRCFSLNIKAQGSPRRDAGPTKSSRLEPRFTAILKQSQQPNTLIRVIPAEDRGLGTS